MGTITRNCPHCHSGSMTFTTFADYADPNKRTPQEYLTAFRCGGCHGGYFVKIAFLSGHPPSSFSGDIDKSTGHKILEEYPQPQVIEAPQYLPVNLQSFFVQAAHSLNAGSFDASAMMSRKVLEVAVKALNSEGSGNLYKRIEQLHEMGKVTDDLKEWAHIIRDNGNDAAHEEEPVSKEFADELLSFTELFLMYTFTMPGMVKAKKGKSEEGA
ncbi:DUF4145 domain-containing protein [Geotalea toluenoxydans]|uniref:DUF4145 domain-containing protein n=1 Tax=Geotalea toluenoxydans TaxID=421624 RepID=UPI000A975055|nr:DUF4145 domain-containing protein [Geotalea toluenoxydans]